MRKRSSLLREFSVPLTAGVLIALAWANLSPESYHAFNHKRLLGPLSFHFVTNDLFMVFFFAIADDAIGLAIIALFYPDPHLPVEPAGLALVVAGMGIAWGLRRCGVRNYWPYLLLGGGPCWAGLFGAHLHPP